MSADRHLMLNRDDLREELRGDWLGEEAYLRRSLNTFFDARWRNLTTGVDERVDLDRYWGINTPDYSALKVTAGYNYLAAYSRRTFKFAHLSSYCKLPTLPSGCPGLEVGFGFETQGGSMLGLTAFLFVSTPANPTGTLSAKAGTALTGYTADITSLMPADAQNVDHRYQIKMDRDVHWFIIDNHVVAVAVLNARNIAPIGPPPYAIFGVERFYPSIMPAFAELSAEGFEATWPTRYAGFNVVDGEEKPSRTLDLYQYMSADLMRGATIAAGSLASHPIPTHGFDTKTIHFRASQAGTLNIEYYLGSGNWRAIPSPPAVVANTLLSFNLLDKVVLARVNFTPSAYPCTISEAEVEVG